jgi:hypothetical protein
MYHITSQAYTIFCCDMAKGKAMYELGPGNKVKQEKHKGKEVSHIGSQI